MSILSYVLAGDPPGRGSSEKTREDLQMKCPADGSLPGDGKTTLSWSTGRYQLGWPTRGFLSAWVCSGRPCEAVRRTSTLRPKGYLADSLR